MTAEEIIVALEMLPHPEGGFYKETYRSKEIIIVDQGERNVSTAIYYLLQQNDRSHFHRIKSDEAWFYHAGSALEISWIIDGKLEQRILGMDLLNNEIPQVVVPANCWFGAKVKGATGFCLVSCTVAPGFDFKDFEMANRKELLVLYPQLESIIAELT